MITFKRTVRTASSERFLGVMEGADALAVDLHYLPNGVVAGTVIILDGAPITDEEIPGLLQQLDDDMLPGVDLETGSLSFTVVRGRVVGNFEPEA